jgi:rubrerythrin
MSIAFSAGELLDIAVGIEKRGIAFYEAMVTATKSEAARELFRDLAAMEQRHVEVFQNMRTEKDKYELSTGTDDEYGDYLKALVNTAVFTDEAAAAELAGKTESDVAAIDIGIAAEKDSLLFYYHMKEILPAAATAAVQQIITEEKLHLSQLTGIKKSFV